MALEVDTIQEIPIEKPTGDEVNPEEDEIENGQAEPLKEPENEVEEDKEIIPFLCWKIEKQTRPKIIKSVILYFGFFSLVGDIIILSKYCYIIYNTTMLFVNTY